MARMRSTRANRLACRAQERADAAFSIMPSSHPKTGHKHLDRRDSIRLKASTPHRY